MIKHINHQNFSTTPFVAAKSWDLYNIQNDDTIVLESSGSEYEVALDYVDYNGGIPLLNRACNIAQEQQDADVMFFQEGITGSGAFDSSSAERNTDGTYKRLIHTQIRNAFYNKRNNPTQIFGVEYIDFPLGQTKRWVSDHFRMFSIPRNIFGEKIQPLSVYFYDNNLDDNVIIRDDGYQNLNAGFDLFSKVQEVRTYVAPTGSNWILSGSVSTSCLVYDDTVISASASDSMAFSMGLESGLLQEEQRVDTSSLNIGFYSASLLTEPLTDSGGFSVGYVYGSLNYRIETDTSGFAVGFSSGLLFSSTVTSSAEDTASVAIMFNSGSIYDQIVWASGSQDTASMAIFFYSGSIRDEILSSNGGDTGTIFIGYEDGYIADVAKPTPTRNEYQTMSIAFLNATSSVVLGGTGFATSSNGTIVPK